MRYFVFLSMFFMLTSCSQYRTYKDIPQKTFRYSYQSPKRVVTSPSFSRHLSDSKPGTSIKIKLSDNKLTSAKLGRVYFSASGYQCRKYMVQSNYEYSACNIGGKWYEVSPIILKN
jgi:hypothetical protein